MFKGVSLFIASLGVVLVPFFVLAAEFNVGDSKVIIEKVRGNVTLSENGRDIASGIVNSELKTGIFLDLASNSEVWLKVVKKVSGESSYLRLSSTTCGTRCSYNQERGIVSTETLSNSAECKKTISFLDRARELAGLQKQDLASAGTSSLVSFAKIDQNPTAPLPEKYEMTPAVSTPVHISERDIRGYGVRSKAIIERITTGPLNERAYVPGSTSLTAGGGGGTKGATPAASGNNNMP